MLRKRLCNLHWMISGRVGNSGACGISSLTGTIGSTMAGAYGASKTCSTTAGAYGALKTAAFKWKSISFN